MTAYADDGFRLLVLLVVWGLQVARLALLRLK
jgi:hypothetical protein